MPWPTQPSGCSPSKGYDATTLEEVADQADVSKSTFFRFFPAKEAAAIEAEAELWSAYLDVLGGHELAGEVLEVLRQTLAVALDTLEPSWDERFLATRRLVAAEPRSSATSITTGPASRTS